MYVCCAIVGLERGGFGLIIDSFAINSLPITHYKRFFFRATLGGNIVSASVLYFCTRLRCLSITAQRSVRKAKARWVLPKHPPSRVMESGGNIVVTVDMVSTDHTVEQQSVKAAVCHKAECEKEMVAAHQKADSECENESDPELVDDDGFQVKRAKCSRRGSPIKDGESERRWT